jgi:hypothetical protein
MTAKNLVTILLGAWLIVGIFVDGFAHTHNKPETFFSPWHAILYSGFLATALWMIWITYQNARKLGVPFKKGIPAGYGLGILGVVLFFIGGVCDMTWHIIFGIEEDIAALLSPSHLLLLVGVLLIITSPYRMGEKELKRSPGFKEFFSTLLSYTLSVAVLSFFMMYTWAFNHGWVATEATALFNTDETAFQNIIRMGISNTIITTTFLMVPVYFLLKRWTLPFGSITLMYTVNFVLMTIIRGFENAEVIGIGVVAGLLADLFIQQRKFTALAVVVPLFIWIVFYVGIAIFDGMGWDPELWTGAIVLSTIWSFILHNMIRVPERKADQPFIELKEKNVI